MRKWGLLGRVVAVHCLFAAAMLLSTPREAFACTGCVTCEGGRPPGPNSTCIAGNQVGYPCGTPDFNTYCTWNCVEGPEGGLIVSDIYCQGASGCGATCYECCP